MSISQDTIQAMSDRGYVLVSGAACVGDTVITETKLPYPRIHALVLNTFEATAVFNKECSSDWKVFRKA